MSLSPIMSCDGDFELDLDIDTPPSTPSSSSEDKETAVATTDNNNALLLVQGLYSLSEYGRNTLWGVAKSVCLRLLSSAERQPRPAYSRALKKHARQSRSPPLSPPGDGPSSSPFPRRYRYRARASGPSSPPRPRIFPATPSTPPGSRSRHPLSRVSLSPSDEPSSSPFPRTRSQISFTPHNRIRNRNHNHDYNHSHRNNNPCSSTFPRTTRVLLSPRYLEQQSSPRSYHSRAPLAPRNSHRPEARTPPLSPRNFAGTDQHEHSLLQRRLARPHARNRDPSPLQIDVRHNPQHAVRFNNQVRVAYY